LPCGKSLILDRLIIYECGADCKCRIKLGCREIVLLLSGFTAGIELRRPAAVPGTPRSNNSKSKKIRTARLYKRPSREKIQHNFFGLADV
jgi:hypothetical protein